MGYESTLSYGFHKAKIENLDELNDKISKLESEIGDMFISKIGIDYLINMKNYVGRFYDDMEFSEIVSGHIVKGYLDLIFTKEDGAIYGFRIYPGKVKRIKVEFVEIF